MKVSEAKTKVCPYLSQGMLELKCICSDCMAWEYTKIVSDNILNVNEIKEEYREYIPNNAITLFGVRLEREDLNEDDKEGYCKRLGE